MSYRWNWTIHYSRYFMYGSTWHFRAANFWLQKWQPMPKHPSPGGGFGYQNEGATTCIWRQATAYSNDYEFIRTYASISICNNQKLSSTCIIFVIKSDIPGYVYLHQPFKNQNTRRFRRKLMVNTTYSIWLRQWRHKHCFKRAHTHLKPIA
jgi:hypothetical protein